MWCQYRGRYWILCTWLSPSACSIELVFCVESKLQCDIQWSHWLLLQAAVEMFLTYCYTDKLEGPDLEATAVAACLEVAIYFGAPHLVQLCEVSIAASLKPSLRRSKSAQSKKPLLVRRPSFLPLNATISKWSWRFSDTATYTWSSAHDWGLAFRRHAAFSGATRILLNISQKSLQPADQLAPSLLSLADDFHLSYLQHCCLDYIVTNYKFVVSIAHSLISDWCFHPLKTQILCAIIPVTNIYSMWYHMVMTGVVSWLHQSQAFALSGLCLHLIVVIDFTGKNRAVQWPDQAADRHDCCTCVSATGHNWRHDGIFVRSVHTCASTGDW